MRVVAFVVFLLALMSGCGGADQSGVSFHSAAHHYSVSQVAAVFAAQGIRLQSEPIQKLPGSVWLREASTPSQSTIQAVVFRVTGSGFTFASVKKGDGLHLTKHGNVMVAFKPAETAAVKAALARLH